MSCGAYTFHSLVGQAQLPPRQAPHRTRANLFVLGGCLPRKGHIGTSMQVHRIPRNAIRARAKYLAKARRNSPVYQETKRLDAAAKAVRVSAEQSYRAQPQAIGLRKRGRVGTETN